MVALPCFLIVDACQCCETYLYNKQEECASISLSLPLPLILIVLIVPAL